MKALLAWLPDDPILASLVCLLICCAWFYLGFLTCAILTSGRRADEAIESDAGEKLLDGLRRNGLL